MKLGGRYCIGVSTIVGKSAAETQPEQRVIVGPQELPILWFQCSYTATKQDTSHIPQGYIDCCLAFCTMSCWHPGPHPAPGSSMLFASTVGVDKTTYRIKYRYIHIYIHNIHVFKYIYIYIDIISLGSSANDQAILPSCALFTASPKPKHPRTWLEYKLSSKKQQTPREHPRNMHNMVKSPLRFCAYLHYYLLCCFLSLSLCILMLLTRTLPN